MTRAPTSNFAFAAIVLGLVLGAGEAQARQGYITNWENIYNPGGQTNPALGSQTLNAVNDDSGKFCAVCHRNTNGGNPFTSYGWDIRIWDAGAGTTTDGTVDPVLTDQDGDGDVDIEDAIIVVEGINSDQDPFGTTNIVEINNHTQPGITTGANNTIYDKSGSTTPNQAPLAEFTNGDATDPVLDFAPAAPDISVDTTAMDFGVVTVGFPATITRTITNIGDADLTISAIDFTGPTSLEYSFTTVVPPPNIVVPPTGTVDVTVQYDPADTTTDAGGLEIVSDDADTPLVSISMTGTGQAAAANCNIDVSPLSLPFGNVPKLSTSSLSFTIDNTGTDPCSVNDLVLSGSLDFDFGAGAPVPPFSVPANGTGPVSVPVDYTPSDVGTDSGGIDVQSNDGTTPSVVVSLSGTGDALGPEIVVSPDPLDFGAVTETFTVTLPLSITNNGDAVLTISNLTLGGTSPDFFINSGTPALPFPVGIGATVDVLLDYTPSGVGDDSDSLDITHDGINTTSPITVALAGSGLAIADCDIDVRPLSIDFGILDQGTLASRTATITNTGLSDCIVTGLVVNGAEFALAPGAPVPNITVPPGAFVDVPLDYLPIDVGEDIGTLDVASSDIDEPVVMVTLVGEGATPGTVCDIVSSAPLLDFGSVSVGATASQSTTLTNNGDRTCGLTVKLASGGTFEFFRPEISFKLAPLGSQPVQVDYSPVNVGTDNSFLNAFSNDPDTPVISVPVTGTGLAVGAAIVAIPSALDYGSVVQGQTKSLVFAARNIGDSDLVVTDLVIDTVPTTEYALATGTPTAFTLVPGALVTIAVEYTPVDLVGPDSTTLTIASNAINAPALPISLTGAGVLIGCDIDVNPLPTLDFGDVVQGLSSSLAVTVGNIGDADCTVSTLSVAGTDLSLGKVPPQLPFTVPPGGAPVSIPVDYAPVDVGPDTGTLTIGNNDPDPAQSPTVVNLAGNGLDPLTACNITVTPPSLNFGAVPSGAVSSLTATIQNTGGLACTVQVKKAAGGSNEFFVPTLNFPLAPLATQDVTVVYRPRNVGADFSIFNIRSDDPDAPYVAVPLTGTGTAIGPEIVVIPSSLDYGEVVEGTTTTLTTFVRNLGDSDLTVGLSIDTVPTPDFAFAAGTQVNFTLTPDELRSVLVEYTPPTAGADSTTLTVTSNDADEPSTVIGLTGNAISLNCDIVVSPTALDYGIAVEQNTTVNQTVDLRNAGNADCIVNGLATTPASSPDFAVTPLVPPDPAITIVPGGLVQATVSYTPLEVASDTGDLEVVSNDPAEPTVLVALSGTAVAPPPACNIVVSPLAIDFLTVSVGATASQIVQVSNTGTADCTVSTKGAGSMTFELAVPRLDFTLTPGGPAQDVTVSYTPVDLGSDFGYLNVLSNDPDQSSVSVRLDGTGI